jgi:hypothetical protein
VEEKGYGPKFSSDHRMISGIRARAWALAFDSSGSTATYTGRPFADFERRTSYSPIATVVTYDAIGSPTCQAKVVRPLFDSSRLNSPLDTAFRPSGTVIVMSYVALSLGWWLPGNQAMEPVGSPRARAPSAVLSQPSCESSGSVIVSGRPE